MEQVMMANILHLLEHFVFSQKYRFEDAIMKSDHFLDELYVFACSKPIRRHVGTISSIQDSDVYYVLQHHFGCQIKHHAGNKSEKFIIFPEHFHHRPDRIWHEQHAFVQMFVKEYIEMNPPLPLYKSDPIPVLTLTGIGAMFMKWLYCHDMYADNADKVDIEKAISYIIQHEHGRYLERVLVHASDKNKNEEYLPIGYKNMQWKKESPYSEITKEFVMCYKTTSYDFSKRQHDLMGQLYDSFNS